MFLLYVQFNTWQSEFIELQPISALLLGRASASLDQSETRIGTHASELCSEGGHVMSGAGMPTWTRGEDGM